jgi:putative transposase
VIYGMPATAPEPVLWQHGGPPLGRMRLLVRPATVVRWHRDLVARRHATRSRRRQGADRAPSTPSAPSSCAWRQRTRTGDTGGSTANSSFSGSRWPRPRSGEILQAAGIPPAPERTSSTWADFPPSQGDALLACDFFETITLSGARLYVFAVIEHANRRIRILGATAQPTASWVAQAAKNLIMDLEDAGCRARYMIRDRDGKFPALFDAILADAGIDIVITGVRMPRMNSLMERWVQTCRRELLDRTLIWNQQHLLHALREFEDFYNSHRPDQGITNARPLRPLPTPITDSERITRLDIRKRDRLGGILHEYQHAA